MIDEMQKAALDDATVTALAQRLDDAWENRTCIEPLSETLGLESPEDAYAIQCRWSEIRTTRGDRAIGHKIGLTSRAMQEQLGIDEPDYGRIWQSRHYLAADGRAEIPFEGLIQPRAEGELAFLIGEPLSTEDVTVERVVAATTAIAPAVEVIDSRIRDWRIKLVDTIADNASYGALVLGPWDTQLMGTDLRTLGMLISHNGVPTVEGLGAAALGHPARCVAWLANRLSKLGVSLNAGDIVLSGALGRAIPVMRSDVITVETHGQPSLTAAFV